jgi:intracellular sulfur oxidation DsrE/DsrF family protein
MKLLLLIGPVIFITSLLHAQSSNKENQNRDDSVSKARALAFKDSLEKAFVSKAVYHLVKSSKWSGVIPVPNADEKPVVSQQYKLLMEVTKGIKDSVEAKDINEALAEVGRLLNIHIAAGIPKKNIDVVVVAHGGILKSFYNNAVYKEKYKIDNPNIGLLNELLASGVKFIVCGQAMSFLNITKEQLLPWMKVALSAQTVLTDYQLRGYVYKQIETDK